MMYKKYSTIEERFYSYVTKTESCWLWFGYKNPAGYGLFSYKSANEKVATPYRAHRVSLILHGIEPNDLSVDHICRNRSCVNPSHLRLVTRAENTLTNSLSPSAINKLKTNCSKGHRLPEKNKGARRVCRKCQNYRNKIRWAKNSGLPSFKDWDGK